MSTLAVKVERIRSVEPHPNADRLDLVQVLDWRCVSQKGLYKAGDLCVYIPIDSILPQELEDRIFGPDSKVKLSKHRVRTIKLRGAISQGLVCSFRTLGLTIPGTDQPAAHFSEGDDLTEMLGVTKYEPPAARMPGLMNGRQATPKETNPAFHKYTDLENAKNYPDVFELGEPVNITEKIHGTNFRAGYVPTNCNTLWKKVKRFFRMLPPTEFVYGSRNVQMQDRSANRRTWLEAKGQTTKNVYASACDGYSLRTLLKSHMEATGLKSIVVYGEVYGDGIQKGYTYGCDPGEHRLVLFDIMADGKYISDGQFRDRCDMMGLPTVPILYTGPFIAELAKKLTEGPSILAPDQKVREGVVIKPVQETTHPMLGRKVLKLISDEYLLKDQTEFH